MTPAHVPRIALADLTSNQYDALHDELHILRQGAVANKTLLEEARDALEAAGINGAHGDDWPRLVPAIEKLAAEREKLRSDLAAADDEATDLALHNDATCEAVAERDRAEATIARVQALLGSGDDMLGLDDIRTALNPPKGN